MYFVKIRRFISIDTAIVVYKQMILPLLEYCNFLLNSGKKCKLDKIDKVQSKCLRIIENCYYTGDHKKENVLCKDYNIDSLQRRRDIACLMYMFSKREYCIDSNVKRSILRSEKKIKFVCPFTRVSKIRKSPFYRGVDLWNKLRVEHPRAENKKRFKDLLKITI